MEYKISKNMIFPQITDFENCMIQDGRDIPNNKCSLSIDANGDGLVTI
jgi:hypothetical protein